MAATLELARQLLGFNTINPPGSEADCMRFFADWLNDRGFAVSLSSFGEGRCNLIARLPGAKTGKPLAFTGHLDTVPLGNARWQYDPFGSQIEDGRLYGRGSSDMKAAIAAFAVACVHQRETILSGRGAVLLITGGEETGCDGARALIASATLPDVGALIVGERVRGFHGGSFGRGRVFPPIVERQPTSGSTACAMRSKPLPDGHPAYMGLRSLKAVEYPCEAAGAAGIPLGTEVRRRSGCPRMIRRCSSAEFCYTNSCRFRVGMWRSLVARLLWEQDVAGSNPVIPTIFPHARF